MDLEAGGRLEGGVDAIAIADGIVSSYRSLWTALTDSESFAPTKRWRITERVQRLNDLGFDIGEMSIQATTDGTQVSIQPKVVDAGHHQRRLLRLTGLDVEENQARRLLNDLDEFRARVSRLGDDEEMVAHEWLTRVFEPVVKAIPCDLRGSSSPPRCSTRCSSTAGTCRRRAAAPCRSPRCSRATSTTCSATAATRRRSWGRRPRRCRSRSSPPTAAVRRRGRRDRLARPGLSVRQ